MRFRRNARDRKSNRVHWIFRTQPPGDGSKDHRGVAYLRRDHGSEWRRVDPVLADREVAYDLDTDTFAVGDGKTPYTGLPRYVPTDPEPSHAQM